MWGVDVMPFERKLSENKIVKKEVFKMCDFMSFIKGHTTPPNLEPITDNRALQLLAGAHYPTYTGRIGHAAATFYLHTTYGGGLEGTGFLVSALFEAGRMVGYAYRFAICNHKKQVGANARPHIGWHPGHCTLCGLDMTVDSGD